jgi:hypothetical protein
MAMEMPRWDELAGAVKRGVSRRGALRRLGTGAAAATLVVGTGLGRLGAVARQSTPAAGTGLYIVIRRYPLVPGADTAELTRRVQEGFVPILRQVPGFVEYYTYAAGSDAIAVSIFTDAAAAEESTRRAASWVAQANLGAFFAGPPEVLAGPVLLHAEAEAAAAGTPVP